jgi:hypothetical protein
MHEYVSLSTIALAPHEIVHASPEASEPGEHVRLLTYTNDWNGPLTTAIEPAGKGAGAFPLAVASAGMVRAMLTIEATAAAFT